MKRQRRQDKVFAGNGEEASEGRCVFLGKANRGRILKHFGMLEVHVGSKGPYTYVINVLWWQEEAGGSLSQLSFLAWELSPREAKQGKEFRGKGE